LQSRGTETNETLADRVNKASYEISFSSHFNYIIVNDNLPNACARAEAIVGAYLNGV
jgi:guanylate kinase